jgi:hypothetical protein
MSSATESQQEQQRAEHAAEVTRQQSWHVDRTIPLVLIFGIMVQTAGAFWWASSQTAINSQQDAQIVSLTVTLTRLAENLTERNERLAKLEAIGDMVNRKVDALTAKLDTISRTSNN